MNASLKTIAECRSGANNLKTNAVARQAGTMLIYLLATGLPFFPHQKLRFPRESLPLSSSYFITGVRLWARKKLTFSLINSLKPLTNCSERVSLFLTSPSAESVEPAKRRALSVDPAREFNEWMIIGTLRIAVEWRIW